MQNKCDELWYNILNIKIYTVCDLTIPMTGKMHVCPNRKVAVVLCWSVG